MKGQIRQPVHCDMVHEHLDFPFAMTVDISFVDTSSENGGTELWLGTHLRGNKGYKYPLLGGPWITKEHVETRRVECPPICPTIIKGSIVIRDMRLWHALLPNKTSVPRPLLTMVNLASRRPT